MEKTCLLTSVRAILAVRIFSFVILLAAAKARKNTTIVQAGSPTQSCTELSGLQIRRITTNALGDFTTGSRAVEAVTAALPTELTRHPDNRIDCRYLHCKRILHFIELLA